MDDIYDAHAHFFSDDVARYPIDIANAREGEENLRKRIATDPLTPERVFALWDAHGIVAGAAVQYNQIYKRDNSYVLDVADAHPERVTAVVMLDAADPATPKAIDDMLAKRNVVGLRLFGYQAEDGSFPWLDSPAALEAWGVIEQRGAVMEIMFVPLTVQAAALARIGALARRFSGVRIALDHVGWAVGPTPDASFSERLLALREQRNIFFKVTTINFRRSPGLDIAAFVRRAADIFGADRIMWGSDVGNTPETYAQMAEQARASAQLLAPDERRQYLYENGRTLFARRG